jgi:mannosyltransferase
MSQSGFKRLTLFDVEASAWKIVLIAFVCALLLRLFMLGSKSFWLDEARSLLVIHQGPNALWEGRSEAYHPPFFYFLMNYWRQLGESEFILRLSSALIGAFSLFLIYPLAKDLFDRRVALSAVWLAVFSPLLVWYSQEFRSYPLLMLLGLLSMLAFVRLCLQPRLGWWLLFVAALVGALYTHYGAVLLLPLQIIVAPILLALRRSKPKVVLFMIAGWVAAAIAYLPWLQAPALQAYLKLFAKNQLYAAQLFTERFHVQFTQIVPILVLIGIAIGAIGLILLYRLFRSQTDRLKRLRNQAWLRWLLVCLFLLSLAIFVVPRGYTVKRQIVILWPYLLIGLAWFWPWGQNHQRLLTAMLAASLVASLANILVIQQDQWREATNYVVANSQPQDLALLVPNYMVAAFDYYDHGRVDGQGATPAAVPNQLAVWSGKYNRIWLVLHATADVSDPQGRIEQWLTQHAQKIETDSFYNIRVELFQKK